MIISASRRTDLPAFYSKWFINRVRAGFCLVINPFNSKQISKISLEQKDVDAFVFWSKNPRPLIPHLAELDQRGFFYYFLYTLNKYPKYLEPRIPNLSNRLNTFSEIASKLGSHRIRWRYDPIIISTVTDFEYHIKSFKELATSLAGQTTQVILSPVEYYRKTAKRLREVEAGTSDKNFSFDRQAAQSPDFLEFLKALCAIAKDNHMEVRMCAQDPVSAKNFAAQGALPGNCVDGALINRFGGSVGAKKDKGQRGDCLCVESRDIGVNHTCMFHCPYCYATGSETIAEKRFKEHDPQATALWSPDQGTSI